MKIAICVCTACHVAGAKTLVDSLQQMIRENNLSNSVELSAKFCADPCNAKGVSVAVDGTKYIVSPDDAARFFSEKILATVR